MVNYKEGEKSEKWSPMKVLGRVRRRLESDLQVSSFEYDAEKVPKLSLEDFSFPFTFPPSRRYLYRMTLGSKAMTSIWPTFLFF